MKARQCDRCGRFYSLPIKNENKIFITVSSTSTLGIKDLCAGCQKEFEEWWMAKKWTEVEDVQKPD